MSMWSFSFTSKSVTGAPYSIKSYSVTQLDTRVESKRDRAMFLSRDLSHFNRLYHCIIV